MADGQGTNRTLFVVALAGAIGFLYQLSEILLKHTAWLELKQPAGVGEILFAVVCGLLAVAAAMGLDMPALIRGFTNKE